VSPAQTLFAFNVQNLFSQLFASHGLSSRKDRLSVWSLSVRNLARRRQDRRV
jgi:hypothetical protein